MRLREARGFGGKADPGGLAGSNGGRPGTEKEEAAGWRREEGFGERQSRVQAVELGSLRKSRASWFQRSWGLEMESEQRKQSKAEAVNRVLGDERLVGERDLSRRPRGD